jgi:hypothetical protein
MTEDPLQSDSTAQPDQNGSGGWVPPPWDPPIAGTEIAHLLGALDRQRATFRWKADGLEAAGLNARIGASALTIGGLLKHLLLEEYGRHPGHADLLREAVDGRVGEDPPGDWVWPGSGSDPRPVR